ncbi:G-protein coupled receptor 55-like [Oncorhynchus keta]|uniref:G-protein coupled receptor 55-like n=1 Tax=Oncorhynchus keta TaxID=8018 RepID=UPI0015FA4298|nr:G-protein coupled receptor 55-like [Oncorhynchus keta]XP_035655334.1 G-protein coupled receptor 55-like [Oncorhynchus keta]
MCNNNNTCEVETLQAVGYLPVFLVGLLLNMAVLRVFLAKRAMWTDTHVYMLNLAAANFSLVFFLPFRIYKAFHRLDRTHFCTFLISTHYINMYASILTVTAISIHRYLAVKYPFHTRTWRSKKVAAVVCGTIWVTVVTICAVFRKDNDPRKLITCYEVFQESTLSVEFLVVLEVLGYLLPVLILVFCSTQTIRVLMKEKDEDEDTTVEKRNIIGIVTANLIVFVVCYTPIHLGFLLRFLFKQNKCESFKLVRDFWLVCEWIATTNCFLDSISYYFMLKQFYFENSRSAVNTHDRQ